MRDHPEWKEAIRFITNLEYTKVLFTGLHKVMAEAVGRGIDLNEGIFEKGNITPSCNFDYFDFVCCPK